MKQSTALVIIGTVAASGIAFLATQSPLVPAVIMGAGIMIGLPQLIPGWWRRAYILTILAMGAGASHISGVAQIGGLAKMGALGLLVLATFLTTRNIQGEWGSRLHKFTINSLWITAALAIASIVWSDARSATIIQAATFVAFVYILHRTSTTRWRDRNVLAGDIGAVYWSAFALLLTGAVLVVGGFPEAVSSFSGRHQGVFNNPNLLGMVSAITTAMGIGWAIHKRSLLVWVSLLIPVSQVILSESRTAIIAAAAAIIWVILRSRVKSIIAVIYAGLTVTLTAMAINWKPEGERFQRFTATEGTGLLNSRTLAWEDVLNYVSSNPMGVGWSATTATLSNFRTEGIGSGLSSIHNSYLQIIYELGWAGIIPAALIVLALFRVILTRGSGLTVGLTAVTLVGTIIQFTESAIFGVGQPYPYLFWFAVVAVAVYPVASRPKTEEPEDVEVELQELMSGKVLWSSVSALSIK